METTRAPANRFDDATYRRVIGPQEVEIETARAEPVEPDEPGEPGEPRRTIIWIVGCLGCVYVRSVRGPRGVWYQEALEGRRVAIWIGGERIAGEAVPVTDPAVITGVSRALMTKYGGDTSLPLMLRPETLPTTLEVRPAPDR